MCLEGHSSILYGRRWIILVIANRIVTLVAVASLLILAGCSLIQAIIAPLSSQPTQIVSVSAPFHIIGTVLIFYHGPVPTPGGPDSSIISADKAVGGQIKVEQVLSGQGLFPGDVVEVSWVTDVGPCFTWNVTPGIQKGDRVEVDDTGNMCTSYMKPSP